MNMNREKLPRTVAFFLAVGVWAFLLLSLWSFSPTDWPSHAVDPHPPSQNLCGTAGAAVAYWAYLAVGQGVFVVLAFAGVRWLSPWRRLRSATCGCGPSGCCWSAWRSRRPSTTSPPAAAAGCPRVAAVCWASGPQVPPPVLQHGRHAAHPARRARRAAAGGRRPVDGRPAGGRGGRVGRAGEGPAMRFHVAALPRLPALPRFVTRDAVLAMATGRRPAAPGRRR